MAAECLDCFYWRIKPGKDLHSYIQHFIPLACLLVFGVTVRNLGDCRGCASACAGIMQALLFSSLLATFATTCCAQDFTGMSPADPHSLSSCC